MATSYKKLWHLLLDKDMNKAALQRLTGVSSATMCKLSKNEPVNMNILVRICEALKCDISDVLEIKEESVTE